MEEKRSKEQNTEAHNATTPDIASKPAHCVSMPGYRRKRPGRLKTVLLLAAVLLCLLVLIGTLSVRHFVSFSRIAYDGVCDVCGEKAIYRTEGVEYCKVHLDGIVAWYLAQKKKELSVRVPD